jgi:hypothetical protein
MVSSDQIRPNRIKARLESDLEILYIQYIYYMYMYIFPFLCLGCMYFNFLALYTYFSLSLSLSFFINLDTGKQEIAGIVQYSI